MVNLSVVIPTYNRSNILRRAVQSVLNQEGDFEVLVIDDGSTDSTSEVIKDFKDDDRVIYLKKENGGVNSARRLGIENSKTDFIAVLDDDDEFLPEAIETIKKRLADLPANINVVYFNSIIDNGKERFVGGFQFENIEGERDFYDPSYEETMIKFNLRGDCKPVFRKSLFENKKYLFPESVNGFESYTMNLIARDEKGIRYFKDTTTLIHQEPELKDRLSINASRKSPWPLLVLHFKQIFEHGRFYLTHPLLFYYKVVVTLKLLVRSIFF